MLVGERQDQAIQLPRVQLGAQPAQPFRNGRLLERRSGDLLFEAQQAGAQLARLGRGHEIQPRVGFGAGRCRDHATDQLDDVLG
jgi:hypothetical protein